MIREPVRSRCPALLLAAALAVCAAPGATIARGADQAAGAGHAILARLVGVWDAKIGKYSTSGKRVESSRAVETSTLCCGDLFLLTDLKGTRRDKSLFAHSVIGYDPGRTTYTLARIDAARPSFTSGEGEYDAAAGVLTFRVSEPDGRGGRRPLREVITWKGQDARTRAVYATGPDGREILEMEVRYKRRR
jgi:hypothetical protein